LLNKYGTLKLLHFGLIPYAILGVIGAFITNKYWLILDRVLLGTATVAIQVSVTSYIAAFFKEETRIKMIAWQGMAIELGGVIFLVIGGILGELNWQFPFFIYLIALVCLFLVIKTLPKPEAKTQNNEVASSTNRKNRPKVQILLHFTSKLKAFCDCINLIARAKQRDRLN
jgi:MFS family permease